MQKHAPKIFKRKNAVPWWNAELSKQRLKMNRARRVFMRCCPCAIKLIKNATYRNEKRLYSSLIKESKKASWEKFVTKSSNENPYNLAYKLGANKMKVKDALTTLKDNDVQTKLKIHLIYFLKY